MTASSVRAPWVQTAVPLHFFVVSQQVLLHLCICPACLKPSIYSVSGLTSFLFMSATCGLPASCPKVIREQSQRCSAAVQAILVVQHRWGMGIAVGAGH